MKTRYCPEIVKKITEAIAREGVDRCGWEAAGIGKTCFYKWLKEYPEFQSAVQEAHSEFTRTRTESEKRQARNVLFDYLFNGIVVRWETSGENIRTLEDLNGNVQQVIREKFTKSHVEHRQCPRWVVEKVLGKPYAILDAVQVLLAEGIATNGQAEIISRGVAEIEKQLKKEAETLTPSD